VSTTVYGPKAFSLVHKNLLYTDMHTLALPCAMRYIDDCQHGGGDSCLPVKPWSRQSFRKPCRSRQLNPGQVISAWWSLSSSGNGRFRQYSILLESCFLLLRIIPIMHIWQCGGLSSRIDKSDRRCFPARNARKSSWNCLTARLPRKRHTQANPRLPTTYMYIYLPSQRQCRPEFMLTRLDSRRQLNALVKQ
jgi:hypothetical protein